MVCCNLCTAALLLAALLAAASPGGATRNPQPRGRLLNLAGRSIVLAKDFEPGQPSKRVLFINTTVNLLARRVHVELANNYSQVSECHTGMDVKLSGRWLSKGAGRGGGGVQAASNLPPPSAAYSFLGQSVQLSGRKSSTPRIVNTTSPAAAAATVQAAQATGGRLLAAGAVLSTNEQFVKEVRTIFIPIAGVTQSGGACPRSAPPKLTAEQIKMVAFEEANPGGATVGGAFHKCSYGKTRLTEENSLVTDMVELPCTGTANGVPWSFSTCEFDDFNGWADAADQELLKSGIKLEKYMFRVYLVPPSPCTFVGMGYVGCDGTPGFECRSWIQGNYWDSPQAIVHEMGHNMFMAHSSGMVQGSLDEYGDYTCGMGFCCVNRCFSTPHAWQLGWLTVQQLDGTSLPPGRTVTTSLASQAMSSQSGLRINTNWVAGGEPIFLGLRTQVRGDSGLTDELAGKVHVYTTPITNTYDSARSTWQGGLAVGQSWEHPTAGVVVRRLRGSPSLGVVVSICRKGGAETLASCQAGEDNDCNGRVGPADPACKLLLKRAAIKPA